MSESKLVDGKTVEPIGGAYTYSTAGQQVGTINSTYVPTTTSAYYGSGNTQNIYTTAYQGTNGSLYAGSYTSGPVGTVNPPTMISQGQIVGTTVNTGKDVIKGESRIEYVPFEKKVIEYKDQAKVERVPKKVKKVQYKEERKIETIPKEKIVTDYYAVEYLRQYIPQYVPEKRIEYQQVAKKQIRYEYIPVERQIVHYPDQPLEAERVAAYQAQQGATTYTTTTTTQPVGYAVNNYSGVVGGNYTTSGAQYVTGTQYATVPQTVYTREAQVVGGTSGTQVVSGGQIVGGTTYIEGAPVTYENTQYTFTQPPVGYEYTTEYRK